jgi:hypothetical protein
MLYFQTLRDVGWDIMAQRSLFCAAVIGSALLMTGLMAGASWAATVEPVQGNLSVNQGQGFQPVNSRVNANVGDSVMVSPGGAAAVTYADGCKVQVQPGTVTTIAPLSPCASGSLADDSNSNAYMIGAGVAAAGAVGFGLYEIFRNNNSSSSAANRPISP